MKKNITAAIVFSLGLLACHSTDNSHLASAPGSCHISPKCTMALPQLPKPSGFSSFYKKTISRFGSALHRGRDVLALPGQEIWIQAKFSYGLLDTDLQDEVVDVYLSQGCNSPLIKIGQALTTSDGQHEAVDGIEDTGGRIHANLSEFGIQSLPIGRHRIVLVVPADNSLTELYIDIVEKSSSIAVSDIDGTLTSSELAAATQLVGISPSAHPAAAEALNILYSKGYHIVYLTARAEWFADKTRAWLRANKFPPGTVRTTQSTIGFNGDQATRYKIAELIQLKDVNGLNIDFGFGNKPSDIATYSELGLAAENSYFFNLPEAEPAAVSFADYKDILGRLEQAPQACQ